MKLKNIFVFILLFIVASVFAQTDSVHLIKVHFLYGSKPLKKYKSTEKKYFGGLHGGHVSIEVDSIDYGFTFKDKFHVFAHKNNHHSHFVKKEIKGKYAYPDGTKFTTFIIPITNEQYKRINEIHFNYCNNSPYDYAFIGMRCAAASQDVLGEIGLIAKRKKVKNVITTFYPKKLRKRIFKIAKKNNYTIISQEGRSTRKWEKD